MESSVYDRMTLSKADLIREALQNPRTISRELNNRSLYHFLQYFWDTVSPHAFQGNWHIEILCKELEKLAQRVGDRLPRQYDLLINVPPGSTKPVWEEMDVLMSDGTYKKLKDIVSGDLIINMKGDSCDVLEVYQQGLQDCVKIITFGGRELVIALDHPVLTVRGWVLGGDILEGDVLALMHKPKIIPSTDRKIEEFRLAGYFIGDGSVTGNNCAVHGKEMEYIDDFITCADKLNFGFYRSLDKNGVTKVELNNKKEGTITRSYKGKFKGMGRGFHSFPGPRKWLREVGIAGKSSYTKNVPDFVWKGTDEQVIAFLTTYFQCDGCVSYRDKGKRNILISVCSVSKELALGVQRLFLRLGISMKIRTRIAKNGFSYNRDLKNYVYYTVDTTDQDSVCRFMEKIPLSGSKARKLQEFKARKKLFEQDFWPDEVKGVQRIGQLSCRCLSVSEGESFIVDGVVVHNTISVSIMFPAWCWTKWHWMRFITASYSDKLSLESAEYCRDLIRSQKFQKMYPDIGIKEDKDVKSNFKIVKKSVAKNGKPLINIGGGRYSTSVGGTLLGFHGDINIWDDPLNPTQAASDVELGNAIRWIEQTLSTRKTNKDVSVTIGIMQRLHQFDPSGHILSKEKENLKHICLPGEIRNYEKQVQPRELLKYYEDDLMDKNRLPWKVLKDLEADLGQYGYAGQIGQNPTPPGGGMFKVDHFQIVNSLPKANEILHTVRAWDKAGTAGAGNYTVGVKMSHLIDSRWIVEDVKRGRWSSNERERIIKETAEADGRGVEIWVEMEPGSSGKESAEGTIRNLAGFICKADRPTGDKAFRADPFSVQVNNGGVSLLNGIWLREYIEEFRFFPYGIFKDQVDSSSLAFSKLVGKRIARRFT